MCEAAILIQYKKGPLSKVHLGAWLTASVVTQICICDCNSASLKPIRKPNFVLYLQTTKEKEHDQTSECTCDPKTFCILIEFLRAISTMTMPFDQNIFSGEAEIEPSGKKKVSAKWCSGVTAGEIRLAPDDQTPLMGCRTLDIEYRDVQGSRPCSLPWVEAKKPIFFFTFD